MFVVLLNNACLRSDQLIGDRSHHRGEVSNRRLPLRLDLRLDNLGCRVSYTGLARPKGSEAVAGKFLLLVDHLRLDLVLDIINGKKSITPPSLADLYFDHLKT